MSAYSEIEETMPAVFNYLEEWGASHKNVPYTGKADKLTLIIGKVLFSIAKNGVLSSVVNCDTILANQAIRRAKAEGRKVKRTSRTATSNIYRVGGYDEDIEDGVIPVDMFENELFDSSVSLEAIEGPGRNGIANGPIYIKNHNCMVIILKALKKGITDLRNLGEDDLADEFEGFYDEVEERKEEGTAKGITTFIDDLFDQIYGIYESIEG